MTTKLTKAFAEFVGERGFEIANADEISQQPEADYKLARQIFRNKRVLLPFLTKLAEEVNAKKRTCKGEGVLGRVAVEGVTKGRRRMVGVMNGGMV